jgi:hypothetical protein
MTARPLTVIPLFTGVPITQLKKKKINVKKVFFGFLGHFEFFYYIKMFFKKIFQKKYLLK